MMDAHNYYSEIKSIISKLPNSDRMLLIEALYVGMLKSANAYYDLVYANEAPSLVKRDADEIKDMIMKRFNEVTVYSGTVTLEGNPMEPMDKSFVSDARMDFDSLIREVSKKSY